MPPKAGCVPDPLNPIQSAISAMIPAVTQIINGAVLSLPPSTPKSSPAIAKMASTTSGRTMLKSASVIWVVP